MSHHPIHVVARVTAQPERVAELAAVLHALLAPTRREAGCIRYQLFRNAAEPCDFVFMEEWSSREAMEAHLQTPHIQEAFAKAGPLLAKAPEISTYVLIELP